MSESKHTPGPWHLVKADPGEVWSYEIVATEPEDRDRNPGGHVIAQVLWTGEGTTVFRDGLANARLIAAAPRLLDECREIIRCLAAMGANKTEWGLRVLALIAEIEGETP